MKPERRPEEPKLFETSRPPKDGIEDDTFHTHPALPNNITRAERERETRGVDVSAEKKAAHPEIFGDDHILDSYLEKFQDLGFKKSLTPEQYAVTMTHLRFCRACHDHHNSPKGEVR